MVAYTVYTLLINALQYFFGIAALFVIGNIIMLFIWSPMLRAVPRNWLVVNMMISELLGGRLFSSTVGMYIIIDDLCAGISSSIVFVFLIISTLTLLGLTVMQWCQISRPFLYIRFQIKLIIQLYILAVWVLSIAINLPLFVAVLQSSHVYSVADTYYYYVNTTGKCVTMNDDVMHYTVFASIGIMLISFVGILAVQISICFVVRKHIRSIRIMSIDVTSQEMTTCATISRYTNPEDTPKRAARVMFSLQSLNSIPQGCAPRVTTLSSTPPGSAPLGINNRTQKSPKKNKNVSSIKSVKIFLMFLLIVLIGWLPLVVVFILSLNCRDCINDSAINAVYIFVLVSSLTSVINPWIYAYRLPDFRLELTKLRAKSRCWCCCCCCCCCMPWIPGLKRED